jgi:DNA-binding MurR/RpiR family transcriptional regulator
MNEPQTDALARRLMETHSTLSGSERKVARFILNNPATALASSAAEIAATAGTSDATVIRAARSLGFSGLAAMRQELARSLQNAHTPADNMRRTIAASGEDVETAMDLVLTTIRASLDDLLTKTRTLRRAVQALYPVQRILVFGQGPTAAIAQYAAAILTRNGRRTKLLDAQGRALADQLLDMSGGDGLLMMAYGTPYREATTTLGEAVRLGLPSVLLTQAASTELGKLASGAVPVPRGKTRHVALHGPTLAALEAIALGLAVADPVASTGALDKLNRLRAELDPPR